MASITIVINDLDKGRGCTVQTNAGATRMGEQRTPAQELAAKLLRTCASEAHSVQFGTKSATLAGELLDAQEEEAAL